MCLSGFPHAAQRQKLHQALATGSPLVPRIDVMLLEVFIRYLLIKGI